MKNEKDYYVKGPTLAERLKEKAEGKWDTNCTTTWRYILIARPLLRVWQAFAGRRITEHMSAAIAVGAAVMKSVPEHIAAPDTHPLDRAAYESDIEQLEVRIDKLYKKMRGMENVAIDAENLARALRALILT